VTPPGPGGGTAARRGRRPPVVVVALAALAVAFLAVPLVGLLQRADWGSLWADLSTDEARSALRLSLVCSLGAVAVSVALGTPLAWALARLRVPGRPAVRALVLLPMVLPPVVGGVALLSAFSLSSPLGGWLHDALGVQLTFSTAGAIVAEAFVAMPFYVITVEGALRTMDRRYEDAAASLGAGRATVFRRVTLPLVAPSVAAGTALAWARALGEFGATITFAGNFAGRTQTAPLAVYVALQEDPQTAVALSLALLVVSVLVLGLLRGRWMR